VKHAYEVGAHLSKIKRALRSGDSIQFVDIPGNPRITITSDEKLEISFDSGYGGMSIEPKAANVIHVGLHP
jgi:hypothetical protein